MVPWKWVVLEDTCTWGCFRKIFWGNQQETVGEEEALQRCHFRTRPGEGSCSQLLQGLLEHKQHLPWAQASCTSLPGTQHSLAEGLQDQREQTCGSLCMLTKHLSDPKGRWKQKALQPAEEHTEVTKRVYGDLGGSQQCLLQGAIKVPIYR